MDIVKLGQVAGIAGIAIGAVVLVFRALIEKTLKGMAPKDRARAVTIIVLCAFGVGIAGIAAWAFAGAQSGISVTTHGAGSPAAVGGRDVNVGVPPQHTPPSTVGAPTAEVPLAPPGVRVETRGDQSPGAVGGRDVTIAVPPTPTPQQQR